MAAVTDTLKLFLAGDVMTARGIDAVLPQPGGRRLLVFGLGTADSGIPPDWLATDRHAGIARLEPGRRAAALWLNR